MPKKASAKVPTVAEPEAVVSASALVLPPPAPLPVPGLAGVEIPPQVVLRNGNGSELVVQPEVVSVEQNVFNDELSVTMRARVVEATNNFARQARQAVSATGEAFNSLYAAHAAMNAWYVTNTATGCAHTDEGWLWTQSPSTLLTEALTWTSWIDADNCRTNNITLQARVTANSFRERGSGYRARPLTPEEQAAEAARLDERRRADRIREANHRAALSRAEILLREHLSELQRQELDQFKYFTVRVVDRKTAEVRFYRIYDGRSGNVHQVDAKGKLIRRLCCHPIADVPNADTMLAQKLWLETMEAAFLALANKTLADGRVIHGAKSQDDALLVLDDEERARRAISLLPANAA